MRKYEKPLLMPADPVENEDGTWSVDVEFNEAFAKEFKKIAEQEPTPDNIAIWVIDTLHSNPLLLKKYLQPET